MHRWKYSALAAATLASVALYAPNAFALALGPVTVQSALGEPLRAEIDLPSITAAEAESLKVGTAPAETFRAQGMEYSGAVSQIQIAFQSRPGGRAVLRLSSSRPVNEPFVDLVIDATWATGRITRSYTMLFDPPATRRAAPAVSAAPQLSTPPASARASAVASARAPVPARVAPATSSTPTATAPAGSVTVKAGDTAGRIANAHRPQNVSLDQMLVAMLRANPDAFIDGNVNRVKAGAVLQLPDAAQASATPAAEARQTIAAQSRDFNSFRRKLATSAPAAAAPAAGATRSASGQVQAQVQEDNAASASPDKLTLSKGGVKGTKATPEALAQRKQASDASARVEELSKNIDELNKLAATGTPAAPATTATAPAGAAASAGSSTNAPSTDAATPSIAVPGPAGLATPDTSAPASDSAALASDGAAPGTTDAEKTVAPQATTDGEPAASAPQPEVAAPAPAVVAPVPVPAEEPSLVDKVLEEPLIPAAVLLLLLLLGYAGYRVSQNRRNAGGVDSSFLESRLQPDSFFGASGGQRVDTAGNDTTTGSSMAFSPSQLDAGGDVDPVAEADVYLAYGRDLQAEEILKEAVRHNPERLSVHAKLADIYAKRQDRKALEAQAKEIFRITNGEGAEWNRVCELGNDIDPSNRYYQPGGQAPDAPEFTAPSSFVSTYGPSEGPPSLPADLDLDLDLDLPEDALTEAPPAGSSGSFAAAALAAATADVASTAQTPLSAAAPSVQGAPAWTPPVGSGAPAWTPPAPVAPAPAGSSEGAAAPNADELDFPLDLPSLDTEPQSLSSTERDAYVPASSGLMDFDMSSVSLDLDSPTTAPAPMQEESPTAATALADDPLATKLALAHEFNAIGDNDGARTLIEEVIAESSGELKARAQRMLKELN